MKLFCVSTSKKKYLFRAVNKTTGVMGSLVDLETIRCIPNVKKDYDVYAVPMYKVTFGI